jgi:segregation and condensation protein B
MTDETDAQQPTDAQAGTPRVTAPPRAFDDEALEVVGAAEAAPVADEAVSGDPSDAPADAPAGPVVVAEGVEPEEAAAFEDLSDLPALIEALLFVADHPIDAGYLARAVEVSGTRVEAALDALAESLRASNRGIRLQRGPQGVLLVSAPEAAAQVERFLGLEANRRLSTAALETLAIIAYRQPVTRGQVDAVRGVSSDGAIATLRARDLIESAGHAAGPGRPMLFRTTQRFLEHFGLERPGQLPALPDDIDLPPGEISAQLGLDEAAVVEALKPRDEPEPEAADVPADDGSGDLAGAEASMEAVLSEAGALPEDLVAAMSSVASEIPDIEIPEDVQALSEAAEQAFEASRERLSGGE